MIVLLTEIERKCQEKGRRQGVEERKCQGNDKLEASEGRRAAQQHPLEGSERMKLEAVSASVH